MGKFHNGVLGTMTGKVGGVVGRTWKGINTVASYQPNVSNPRTNSQMAQRGKLTALTLLASLLNTGFIKPLWDRDAKKMSGFNAFIQANMANVSNLGVVDFASLIASKGKMVAPSGLNSRIIAGNVTLQFSEDIQDSYGLPTDKVYAFLLKPETGEVFVSSGIKTRADGSVTFENTGITDDGYYVFVAFRRADGSMASNSGVIEA